MRKTKFAALLAALAVLCAPVPASSAEPVVLGENTPIIIPLKPMQLDVLVEGEQPFSIDEAIAARERFVPAASIAKLESTQRYWVSFDLSNTVARDRDFRLSNRTFGLRDLRVYVVHADGERQTYDRNYIQRPPQNELIRANPFFVHEPPGESQYLLLPLRRGETLRVYAKVELDQRFLPNQFNFFSVVDHARYLEMRRFGMYIEGALAGALFALAFFGWYSYYRNRDRAGLLYGVWIIFAFFSVMTLGVHDGQRFGEFFFNFEQWGMTPSGLSARTVFAYLMTGGQSIAYVLFARSFLDLRTRFPKFYLFSSCWIVFYILHVTFNLSTRHTIPPNWLWNPLFIWLLAVLLGIYTCAYIRFREGMGIAKFFMIAMIPYVFFRSLFLLGIVGLPSPVASLPDVGVFFQLKDSNSMQGFGVVCEALIMALAVVARSRWLQDELTRSMQAQQELVSSQNRVLEATVAERTRELEEQHRELEEVHQFVVSSVNYASRLQRSQLPRQHRIDGRFASIGVIWEPRDTIGGDLWWLSTSQRDGPYSIAVADCTGHGVPGAMLSLLVSNSLERIYSNDPDAHPADALLSLDFLVRAGLNQDADDGESDDGCDAMIMRIDRERHEILFAGAKIGIFQLKVDGDVVRHRATRASLGYRQPPADEDWPDDQLIRYQPGDAFVIATDGFTDQIGGEGAVPTSFGYRRIEQVLASAGDAPATIIAERLREEFERWRGAQMARDDVTVIAFRL